MKWKLSPPESRGPPPFKGTPKEPWPEKIQKLSSGLVAKGFSWAEHMAYEPITSARDQRAAQISAAKEGGSSDEFMAAFTEKLSPGALALRDELMENDKVAVEQATVQAKVELGLPTEVSAT